MKTIAIIETKCYPERVCCDSVSSDTVSLVIQSLIYFQLPPPVRHPQKALGLEWIGYPIVKICVLTSCSGLPCSDSNDQSYDEIAIHERSSESKYVSEIDQESGLSQIADYQYQEATDQRENFH